MFDTKIRSAIDKPMRLIARAASMCGMQADHVTWLGFITGISAGVAIMFGAFHWALFLLIFSRFCDGLDGTIARLTKPTDKGAFLDIALDFLFYSFVPFSFAIYDAANALAAAFLIFSFVGTGTSFLAYAIIAEKNNITPSPDKGIYYLGGLTEGAETILLLCAFCIWPQSFIPLAVLFGMLCLLTTAIRLYRGMNDFDDA